MPGILYVVATPIGNLEDVSFRAVRILKEAAIIAAEDTRHTKILLEHYGIATRLTSYHEHNEENKAKELVRRLVNGENVALVCDAGTPAISDPGYRLVIEAIRAGVTVVPVPGPSALIAVLSAAGLPTDRFVFEGFLPGKINPRRQRLEALRGETRTMVFYEAPHRLRETLEDMLDILGDREVVLAREVSKIHEEFLRGRISEVAAQTGAHVRGELTLVVAGSTGEAEPTEDTLLGEIRTLKRAGMRVKEIAELLGERYSYSKREIYRLALERPKKVPQ